jgi:environmental stress-induced protein Ves
MKVTILNTSNYTITKWDGGTTHQLLILPLKANYAKLNFKLRLSKAVINAPQSTFSKLPGVTRNLLYLEGISLLSLPKNRHQLLLPGDEINFKGELPIHCKGKGKDFNVMHTGDANVSSQLLNLDRAEVIELDQTTAGQFLFLHAHKGEIKVSIGANHYILKQEMSLYIDKLNEELPIFIEAKKAADIILAEVLLK